MRFDIIFCCLKGFAIFFKGLVIFIVLVNDLAGFKSFGEDLPLGEDEVS